MIHVYHAAMFDTVYVDCAGPDLRFLSAGDPADAERFAAAAGPAMDAAVRQQ